MERERKRKRKRKSRRKIIKIKKYVKYREDAKIWLKFNMAENVWGIKSPNIGQNSHFYAFKTNCNIFVSW